MDVLFVFELKLHGKKLKASHAEFKLDFELRFKIEFELKFELELELEFKLEFEWWFELEFKLEFELELELHFKVQLKLVSVVGKGKSTLKSTQSVSALVHSFCHW